MAQVKICANTNLDDAKLSADLGADYLGFIFAESKRRVKPVDAKAIVKAMPDFKNFVGVFFNQPKKEVLSVAEDLGIRILQFHGDETALYCRSFLDKGYDVIKTFRIKDAMSLKRIDEYRVSAFLFDTYSREEKGGTGVPFDWSVLEARPFVHEKLFLAGGLNVENLEKAIVLLNPFAVDVASGVEARPGKKDPDLLRKFIEIAKAGGRNHAQKRAVRR